jgi:folate-dependent phosphoribosylglycinamide formyltransferase PurN
MGRDPLTMGYLDILDNEFLNKYEKILKIEKKTL